jgi:hypothetical protein
MLPDGQEKKNNATIKEKEPALRKPMETPGK